MPAHTKIEEQSISYEDRLFIKKVKDDTHQREDNYYGISLPFKEDEPKIPNNKQAALTRLSKLKKSLVNDEQHRNDYLSFMTNIINRGYAERVP